MPDKKDALNICIDSVRVTRKFDMQQAVGGIDETDQETYRDLVATELSPEQVSMVLTPEHSYPRQKSVLAIHWHPEWIPLDLVSRRIGAAYPNREQELIIPTQHNELMTYGDYAGVEVDCYSSGFNRKVQLLLHFKASNLKSADVLKSMLEHTFKYRTSQLFQFMDAVLDPKQEEKLSQAVMETGANEQVVGFVRFYTARLKKMIEMFESETPRFMIKNKLLTEYMDAQRDRHRDINVNRAILLLKAVKKIVKRSFSLEYFFRATEVIEEARSLGGCVVIPHPEQFWPILLADYDVDGYEVWNPQSREYTEFLIRALTNQNKRLHSGKRRLLIFMGDDTHMSAKIKDPERVERSKREREVGLQPAWDELPIRKSLSLASASRAQVIRDYKGRLG